MELLLLHLGLLLIIQGPVVLLVGLETCEVALGVVVLMLLVVSLSLYLHRLEVCLFRRASH